MCGLAQASLRIFPIRGHNITQAKRIYQRRIVTNSPDFLPERPIFEFCHLISAHFGVRHSVRGANDPMLDWAI